MADRHRYALTQVPTLGLRSIKTVVTGGTKVTGGTCNCPMEINYFKLFSKYLLLVVVVLMFYIEINQKKIVAIFSKL